MSNKEVLVPELEAAPQLFVETQERGKIAITGHTDWDGTAARAEVPEIEKEQTTEPARKVVRELELKGISTGMITDRALGKALYQQSHLRGTGFTIAEGGSAVCLPVGVAINTGTAGRFSIINYGDRKVVLLSQTPMEAFREFILDLDRQYEPGTIASSLTSSAEELAVVAGHNNSQFGNFNRTRVASANIRLDKNNPNAKDILIDIQKKAYDQGFRTGQLGSAHVTLFGAGTNKAHALELINENPDIFFPGIRVDGIAPVVFANDYNDLHAVALAGNLGAAVMVGKEGGGFHVAEDQIPTSAIKTPGISHGFGMHAALPEVYRRLKEKYPEIGGRLPGK